MARLAQSEQRIRFLTSEIERLNQQLQVPVNNPNDPRIIELEGRFTSMTIEL